MYKYTPAEIAGMTPFQQLCLTELDQADTGPLVFDTIDDYQTWAAHKGLNDAS